MSSIDIGRWRKGDMVEFTYRSKRTDNNVKRKGVIKDVDERTITIDPFDDTRNIKIFKNRRTVSYPVGFGGKITHLGELKYLNLQDLAEVIDAPSQVGGWELEDTDGEMVSYVDVVNRDGNRYLVYMEITDSGFRERRHYSLRGAVFRDGEFLEDFTPSEAWGHGDPFDALEVLVSVMKSLDAEDIVDDVAE